MANAARKPFVSDSEASSPAMSRTPSPAWFALAAAIAATSVPAAAQVQVVVDGRTQEVPAGVIRTISYEPGGRQTVRDEPFRGQTAPGYATITTTATTDSDEDGSHARTHIVTRIEPIAVSAVSYAPTVTVVQNSYPPQTYAQPGYVQPGYAQPATGDEYAQGRPPHLDVDSSAYDPDVGTGQEKVIRVHRDGMTGHFVANVLINGVRLKAIIDTGAQSSVLSPRDAQLCGADHDIVSSTPMSGITGTTMLNVARVRSFEIAGQNLGSFRAAIGSGDIPYTLLGQTEIAKLGRLVIQNGVMEITPRALLVASR